MSLRLAPYPEYKDSGVQWIGEAPKHWCLVPGLSVFREKQRKNSGMAETTVLSLSYGRVIVKGSEKLHGLVPESFETYQIIAPGDIIIRPTDLQNDHVSLRVGAVRDRGIITSAYICLQPIGGMTGDYGYLLLHAYDLKKVFYGMGFGLRQNLDFGDFKRMPTLVPPPEEQQAIVHFLDHADRRINRLIRAKRRLIELLNEQKQAIIHRAVTRGLDPDVRLKPSGVDWLGDVPEHWEVKKLRLLFRYAKGRRAAELTNEYIGQHQGVFPVYSGQTESGGLMGQIAWHEFDFSDPVVLVTTVGARAMTTRLVCERFSLSQNCALLIPRDPGTDAAFFELVFQRVFDYEKASISLIMQPSLRFGDLNRFYVPCPPAMEQSAIAAAVAHQVSDIDGATDHARSEIDLLREYRTRLIADVVTGKLDVRGVELPPLADNEPLDGIDVGADADADAIDDAEESDDGN